MRFLISMCLLFPGTSCEPPDVIDHLANAAIYHASGPSERWRPLVESHFPDEQVDRALCIIKHESSGEPTAKNPRSSARGLFQILGSLWAPRFDVTYEALYEPELNVALAKEIWELQGWRAWSPYNRGLCR